MLDVRNLSFSYGTLPVFENLSARFETGICAILGPNAAGKSTFLKSIAGLNEGAKCVFLDDRNVAEMSVRERIAAIAYSPQNVTFPAGLTVFEAVLLGRHQELGWHVPRQIQNEAANLMREIEIDALANRYLNELSGGQRQLVQLAQAFIRKPKVLLLDEPVSNLDLRHQLQICAQVRAFSKKQNIVVLIVLHDLNLALQFADTVCVLCGGRIEVSGSPRQVITESLIRRIYGIDSIIMEDTRIDRPVVCPTL